MDLLKLGNLQLLNEEIKKFEVSYNKIDGEGTKRNLAGTMRRQVIAQKIKIEVTLVSMIEPTRLRQIIKELNKNTSTVIYYDEESGTKKTIRAYFNTTKTSLYARLKNKYYYDELSFAVIEL